MNGSRNAPSATSRRKEPSSQLAHNSHANERRVATPRADLIVVKVGDRYFKHPVRAQEKASTFVAKIAKATRKPGTSRKSIFRSSVGKTVYAYSVYPRDTTKIVRENAKGERTVGRLVNGRFRALPAKSM
ncbi:MAG: hypothetical protein JWO91_189 [Acidobacteriaceae bacterium]|nr:hypothetical protein [Acidobacteriaceae bacterium]